MTHDIPLRRRIEIATWSFAVSLFVLGDLITTYVGFHFGAVEGNALPATAIDAVGPWSLLILKATVVGVAFVMWRFFPQVFGDELRVVRPVVPASLGVIGSYAVLSNAVVLHYLVF